MLGAITVRIIDRLSVMGLSSSIALCSAAFSGSISSDSSLREYIASVCTSKSLPLTEPPEERKILCMGAFGAGESFFTVKESLEAQRNFLQKSSLFCAVSSPPSVTLALSRNVGVR